jgi:hypothetical protein
MKDIIAKLFGIETYKLQNDRLAEDNNKLARMLEEEKAINKSLAADFVKMEEELKLLKADPEQYIEVEVEKRMMQYEKEHNCEMNHKWYCIGRQDAYSEMGIKAIEANKRGNHLRILENGEIVELITDLEDVTAKTKETTTADEIEIGDLA